MTYAEAQKEAWEKTVDLAVGARVCANPSWCISQEAHNSRISESSLLRKAKAIWALLDLGVHGQQIKSMGQREALKVAEDRIRQSKGKIRQLRYDLPADLCGLWEGDYARIGACIGSTRSEDIFDFLHSLFEGIPDEQIRHLAGEGKPKRG
jgi:hypothetical protein